MKFLCIGDSCVDEFIYGECKRICPEAPVPVFNPKYKTQNAGMAGNVAANLIALGGEVTLITNQEIIKKTRYIDEKSNAMLLRVDEGDSVSNSFQYDGIQWDDYDAVLISDYSKGFLTKSDIEYICHMSELSFLDTKKILGGWAAQSTFVKINEAEWNNCLSAGQSPENWEHKLIITMSERGCAYNGRIYPATEGIKIFDVSGAGDTFLAALAFRYARTKNIDTAIEFANICSANVVQKRGVVTI